MDAQLADVAKTNYVDTKFAEANVFTEALVGNLRTYIDLRLLGPVAVGSARLDFDYTREAVTLSHTLCPKPETLVNLGSPELKFWKGHFYDIVVNETESLDNWIRDMKLWRLVVDEKLKQLFLHLLLPW